MDERLTIDAARIDAAGEEIEGVVAAVDLDEEFVKARGGLRYRLQVQIFGTEMLVRGSLSQDFGLVCSRCGKDFADTVEVGDFTASYELGDRTSEVDLTEDARESIILALPTYPVCAEACPGIAQKVDIPADDRWSALDGLAAEQKENQ